MNLLIGETTYKVILQKYADDETVSPASGIGALRGFFRGELSPFHTSLPFLGSSEILDNCWALPRERIEVFFNWVPMVSLLINDVVKARQTFMEIAGTDGHPREPVLGFCKTVGQLNRALPDLARFLPDAKLECLKNAQRSSAMPAEWGKFATSRVMHLQEVMTKCMLLPATTREGMRVPEFGFHHAPMAWSDPDIKDSF